MVVFLSSSGSYVQSWALVCCCNASHRLFSICLPLNIQYRSKLFVHLPRFWLGETAGSSPRLTEVLVHVHCRDFNIFASHGLLPSDLVAQSVERRRSGPKVVGSIPTLVRVFLCPCVGPFPSVGLTLAWFIWDWNLALHITLYSVNYGNRKPRFYLDFFRLIYAAVKRGRSMPLLGADAIKEICIFLQINRSDN